MNTHDSNSDGVFVLRIGRRAIQHDMVTTEPVFDDSGLRTVEYTWYYPLSVDLPGQASLQEQLRRAGFSLRRYGTNYRGGGQHFIVAVKEMQRDK